jgi:hypothetical protein
MNTSKFFVGALAACGLAIAMAGCGSDLYGSWNGQYQNDQGYSGANRYDSDPWSRYGESGDHSVQLALNKGGTYNLYSGEGRGSEDGTYVVNNNQVRLQTLHRDGEMVRDEPPHTFKLSGDHNNITAKSGASSWNFTRK